MPSKTKVVADHSAGHTVFSELILNVWDIVQIVSASTSGLSRLIVGGTMPSFITLALITASMPPAAPKVTYHAFTEEILRLFACPETP